MGYPDDLKLKSSMTVEFRSVCEQPVRYPDDLKLKSSMTLFYEVTGEDVFKKVLDKFYGGQEDRFTVDAIRKGENGK